MTDRRNLCRACMLALAAAAAASPAAAQTYPARPVSLLVSFAAGGVADVVARLVALHLGERGAGTFIVENRGGAGGNLAARAVSTAAADGYTVLATTTALAINATVSRNKGYANEDLRAVAISAIAPDVMAVHPSNAAKTIKDLVANARDKGLNYASSGVGTGPYISSTYFFQEIAKIKASHVPFTGGAPAVAAAMGNHVEVIIVGLPTAQSQVEKGLLRGLGITSAKRNAALPDVPTYAEAGYPSLFSATWVGFFVPAKTPEDVVVKLNAEINAVLRAEAARKRLEAIGFEPLVKTTTEAAEFVRSEIAQWGRMARAIGFTTE